MNRPKKEDYVHTEICMINDGEFALRDCFDYKSYTDELNNYIDQLEKAFDKACGQLAHAYPCGINGYGTNCHLESWKEWCMRDEEDNRQ